MQYSVPRLYFVIDVVAGVEESGSVQAWETTRKHRDAMQQAAGSRRLRAALSEGFVERPSKADSCDGDGVAT